MPIKLVLSLNRRDWHYLPLMAAMAQAAGVPLMVETSREKLPRLALYQAGRLVDFWHGFLNRTTLQKQLVEAINGVQHLQPAAGAVAGSQ